jgi:hypothetical protein
MNNETTILEVILKVLAMPVKPLFALAAFWIVCDLTLMAVRCVMDSTWMRNALLNNFDFKIFRLEKKNDTKQKRNR